MYLSTKIKILCTFMLHVQILSFSETSNSVRSSIFPLLFGNKMQLVNPTFEKRDATSWSRENLVKDEKKFFKDLRVATNIYYQMKTKSLLLSLLMLSHRITFHRPIFKDKTYHPISSNSQPSATAIINFIHCRYTVFQNFVRFHVTHCT